VVQLADGNYHPCDYVIVTSSLGYLKHNKKCFFCPELPESRSKAIDKLGFCNLNRIFLEYSRPFWNPDTWGVTFIPNLEKKLKPGSLYCLTRHPFGKPIARLNY
jgi:monoamine oxidase